MLFLMGCWGNNDCQEPSEDTKMLFNGCARFGQSAWGECVKPCWVVQRGMEMIRGAASACWISPALQFSCCHTPGWKMSFSTPRRVAHHQSKLWPGSASDLYGFEQVVLLLSASCSLCLFSPSHLFSVKPLRWHITSGVWKLSAQWASDFD